EAAVIAGYEARAFVAVAPRGVFQRAPADRRPEPGDRVPACVLAGRGRTGDLALPECVTPVLDPQRPARSGVVGLADVAGREQSVALGAHRGIDGDGAAVELESGLDRELRTRADPHRHHDRLGLDPVPAGGDRPAP